MDKGEVLKEVQALLNEGSWVDLKPYFDEGKLLICQRDSNLEEIGCMLVLDEEEKIKKLTEISVIAPPDNESLSQWRDSKDQILFKYIEILPYCLAKLL